MAKGVPVAQITRVLQSLRRQLGERALTELTIYADGRRVVALGRPQSLAAGFGPVPLQLRCRALVRGARDVASLSTRRRTKDERPHEVPTRAPRSGGPRDGARARVADRSAGGLSPRDRARPDSVMAHINLGCLLHAAGQHAAAERHYRKALKCAGDHALAWYNLGVLLEDRQRPDEALSVYERAILADPDLADAHYNAALLYEWRAGTGRRAPLRHL